MGCYRQWRSFAVCRAQVTYEMALLTMSSCSTVDRAPDWCLGGHAFYSRLGCRTEKNATIIHFKSGRELNYFQAVFYRASLAKSLLEEGQCTLYAVNTITPKLYVTNGKQWRS
ncbi:hypothetical protein ACROYT_G040424 [Oculina patagonica]